MVAVVDEPKSAVNRPARRRRNPLLESGNGKVPQHQGHRSHDQHRRQQQQTAFDRSKHRIPFQAVCKRSNFPYSIYSPPFSYFPDPCFPLNHQSVAAIAARSTTVATILPSGPNAPPFNSEEPVSSVTATLGVLIPLTPKPNTQPWKKFQEM